MVKIEVRHLIWSNFWQPIRLLENCFMLWSLSWCYSSMSNIIAMSRVVELFSRPPSLSLPPFIMHACAHEQAHKQGIFFSSGVGFRCHLKDMQSYVLMRLILEFFLFFDGLSFLFWDLP